MTGGVQLLANGCIRIEGLVPMDQTPHTAEALHTEHSQGHGQMPSAWTDGLSFPASTLKQTFPGHDSAIVGARTLVPLLEDGKKSPGSASAEEPHPGDWFQRPSHLLRLPRQYPAGISQPRAQAPFPPEK